MVFKISYSMFLSFFAIPRHSQIPPRSSLLPTHSTFCPFSYRITRKTERKSTKRKSGAFLVWVSAWAGVCPRVWLTYPMSQHRGKPVLPRLAAIIFKQFLESGGTTCSLPLLQAGIFVWPEPPAGLGHAVMISELLHSNPVVSRKCYFFTILD